MSSLAVLACARDKLIAQEPEEHATLKELPKDVCLYKRTPEFCNDTVPRGLLRAHQTREGTWGKIIVQKGRLLYRILEPEPEEIVLSSNKQGIVEPTVRHEVEPLGMVSFHVEFYK